jgi:hypothetical protein
MTLLHYSERVRIIAVQKNTVRCSLIHRKEECGGALSPQTPNDKCADDSNNAHEREWQCLSQRALTR